jgi:hypothetical protein
MHWKSQPEMSGEPGNRLPCQTSEECRRRWQPLSRSAAEEAKRYRRPVGWPVFSFLFTDPLAVNSRIEPKRTSRGGPYVFRTREGDSSILGLWLTVMIINSLARFPVRYGKCGRLAFRANHAARCAAEQTVSASAESPCSAYEAQAPRTRSILT